MRVKLAAVLCLAILLTGCKSANKSLEQALLLRNKLSQSNGCRFSTTVVADYGEQVYTFAMDCQADSSGNLEFEVTSPETIAGITGKISNQGGAITFDDKVLGFQTMADDRVTPVTAPWLFIKSLCSGYLKDCCEINDGIQLSLDDSYNDHALHLQVLVRNELPVSAEIFWDGCRCLTLTVENFTYL